MHRAAVIFFLSVCAGPALAHPNHAGGSPLGAGLLHLLTEPDHLAALVLPLVVAVAIVLGLHRRRARRTRRDKQAAPARRPRGRRLR